MALSIFHKESHVRYPFFKKCKDTDYLELSMKAIIYESNPLLDKEDDYPHVHHLTKLWKQCRPILEEVFDGSPLEMLDNAERVIQQIDQHDSNGEAFRYSHDKKGQPYLGDINHINIRNLREVMERLGNLLDASNMGISALAEQNMGYVKGFL